jgi:ABC-2 type transport system ATP-binding protein
MIAGHLSVTGRGKDWTIACKGEQSDLRAMAARPAATVLEEQPPSLNELFIAYAGLNSLGARTNDS